MIEPTEAQKKEFWKWCGIPYEGYGNADRLKAKNLPDIDPNNLLKYAIPKLKDKLQQNTDPVNSFQYRYFLVLQDWITCMSYGNEDPALALFWALWQVKEKEDV